MCSLLKSAAGTTVCPQCWTLTGTFSRVKTELPPPSHTIVPEGLAEPALSVLSEAARFSLDAATRLLVITTFLKIYSTVNPLLHPRSYFDWLVEEFITN